MPLRRRAAVTAIAVACCVFTLAMVAASALAEPTPTPSSSPPGCAELRTNPGFPAADAVHSSSTLGDPVHLSVSAASSPGGTGCAMIRGGGCGWFDVSCKVGQAIEFANALSAALLGQGVDAEQASRQLSKIILHSLNPAEVGIFLILVAIWAVLLGAILTFIFVIRIMLTILLIAAAPLALACHALPQTEGLAKLWWRAFAGVLAIQVAQALVFITAMKVVLTTDMVTIMGVRTPGDQLDLWITICLLYVLVRIPSWISRLVWRGGLASSPITRTAKTIAALNIFRSVLGKARAGRAATRRTPGGPPPLPPGGAPPARPPGPPPAPAQPQPRWGHPDRRWMPPDPHAHEQAYRGRPPADSPAQQQRWGNPATTWTPPRTGNWRAPPPTPRRPPPAPPPHRPDPARPWNRPN